MCRSATLADAPVRAAHSTLAVRAAIAIALLAPGCSDDDTSAQERYCEAGESLESSVSTLADLDLAAGGTNGLESAQGVYDTLTDCP